MTEERPLVWILDSARTPLADFVDAFYWADAVYIAPDAPMPDWSAPPDAVFFSAELAGGAGGSLFADLFRCAEGIPLLAVAKLRSLAQAVALFRAGAMDYLSLPLDEDDARDRFFAALERSGRQPMPTVMVEAVKAGKRKAGRDVPSAGGADAFGGDILAELGDSTNPEPAGAAENRRAGSEVDEEPAVVDGLPIPSLWEELPCGLLVFDSAGNLAFANVLAMDLFGQATLAELQEALDAGRASLAAYSSNGKPLPDNQWPQALAVKSRTARSAVVSIERPDRRRVWLRIDCLPHLFAGRMTRLSMAVVNLTGELPPLAIPEKRAQTSVGRNKSRPGGKRRR